MQRLFLTLGGLTGIAIILYIGYYFFSVHEGAPRTAVGIASKPEYDTPLSQQTAERFFFPIHALDRKFFRRAKWGDYIEAMLLTPFVPSEASNRTCKFHRVWRTNAIVPITYGDLDPTHPYVAARKVYFPNSWSRLEGGCVSNAFATQAMVRVCRRCRDAEQKWNHTNH